MCYVVYGGDQAVGTKWTRRWGVVVLRRVNQFILSLSSCSISYLSSRPNRHRRSHEKCTIFLFLIISFLTVVICFGNASRRCLSVDKISSSLVSIAT